MKVNGLMTGASPCSLHDDVFPLHVIFRNLVRWLSSVSLVSMVYVPSILGVQLSNLLGLCRSVGSMIGFMALFLYYDNIEMSTECWVMLLCPSSHAPPSAELIYASDACLFFNLIENGYTS